jgi:hypothetical protein
MKENTMTKHLCIMEITPSGRCRKPATCYISHLDAWFCTIHGLLALEGQRRTENAEALLLAHDRE